MPFCAQCGSETTDRFCPKCGAAIGPVAAGPGAAGAAGATAGQGLTDNAASALCYLLGLVTGVLFLVMAPYNQNPRVKFHAWQSVFFSIAWIGFWIVLTFVSAMLSFIALILLPIEMLIGLAGFCLWLYCMWKAYNGEMFEIPVIGPLARQQAAK